jgi:hypothetical protein
LRAYAETGPPLDVVAIFLRRLAQGAFPDNLPADIPPIFRDHLDNLLARAKEQGRHDAESDA